jgi:hypothetical protein
LGIGKRKGGTHLSALRSRHIANSTLYPQKLKRHTELETRLQTCYDEWAVLAQQIKEANATFNDLQ